MFSVGTQGSSVSTYPSKYKGNPNAVTTSINMSGGIVMSRSSGNYVPANPAIGSPGSPACVQVSASNISATGSITAPSGASIPVSAVLDLEMEWDFGDPTGTEVIENPVTGAFVNANNAQTGHEAAYSYRPPAGGKTYTITLYVRGKTASGKDVTGIATTTFTAVDLTAQAGYKAWYVDSVNGNDSWSGTLPQPNAGLTDGPKQTMHRTSPVGLMGVVTNNSCCFLANGSTWQDQGNIVLPNTNAAIQFIQSGVRLTSYVGKTSSTTPPTIAVSTSVTNGNPLFLTNGSNGFGSGSSLTDIVVSYIDFVSNGGTLPPCAWLGTCSEDPSASMYDVYIDNCNFTQTSGMASSGGNNQGCSWCRIFTPYAPDAARMGIWNCTFVSPSVGANSLINAGIAPQASEWFFVVGCLVNGDGGDNTRGHSCYSHVGSHLLYRWYSNKPPGVDTTYGLNYALNIESDPIPAGKSSGVLGCAFACKIPTAGTGAGASTTLNLTARAAPLPLAVGMIAQFNGMSNPCVISAALFTSITSFTYGAGIGTITVSGGHNVTTGKQLDITVSGADAGYNGSYTATATNATTLTVSMANPGSSSATVPGSYTGGSWTITPMANNTIPTYTGSAAAIYMDALCNGTLTASTNTLAITAGTLILGNGTANVQVGDIAVFPGTMGSPPLLWAPISTVTGNPATSFTVSPYAGVSFINGSGNIYILPAANLPTVVDSTLVSGCMMATTNGGHSGNSSTNHADMLYYTNFVCEDSAFVNLQLDGSVANCLQSYTMRNCFAWSTVNNTIDGIWDLTCSTGNMASTVRWACHGNKHYNPFSSTFFNDNNQSPTSPLPLQLTDNEFWNTNASGQIVSLDAPHHGNSIIDRNSYNAPASATFLVDAAAGTAVSFVTWQGLGTNFDPNSSNINNATPASGVFSDWITPVTSVSNFGTI